MQIEVQNSAFSVQTAVVISSTFSSSCVRFCSQWALRDQCCGSCAGISLQLTLDWTTDFHPFSCGAEFQGFTAVESIAVCTCAAPKSYRLVLYMHFVLHLCCVLWEGCSGCNTMCVFPGFSQSTVDFCAVSWNVFLWLQHASFPLPPRQPQQFLWCCMVVIWFAGNTGLCYLYMLVHH